MPKRRDVLMAGLAAMAGVGGGPAPRLSSYSPIPTASTTPQVLTVFGSRLKSGLIPIVSAAAPGTIIDNGTASLVTSTSFVWTVTLPTAGVVSLRVQNPDGKWSNTLGVTVNSMVISPTPQYGPRPGPFCPAGAIHIAPGTSIQSQVDANPNGTAFCLESGVHVQQQVTPKTGNAFYGELGTVMDGRGITEHAFETLATSPSGVVIQGIEIRNYVPSQVYLGAIQGDNGTGWIVTDCVVHDCANYGVRTGVNGQVLRNAIYANGKDGIGGFQCDGALIAFNDVYGNNPSGASSGQQAGMKFTGCLNLTIRNNRVNANGGVGIWTDTINPGYLCENNLVTNNLAAGIWHEISYSAVIRNNTVDGNGTYGTSGWLSDGGINSSNSPNVEIYGNTVRDNNNSGIGIMYATGYPASGPYGDYIVDSLSVHDNIVRMPAYRTGLVTNTGDSTIYTSHNNHFEKNSYFLTSDRAAFAWQEVNKTFAQWQSAGNDTTGSMTLY